MSNPEKETSEYTLDKDIKVLLEWYYETNYLKKEKKEEKKIDNSDEEEKEEKEKEKEEIIHLQFSTFYEKRLILHWGIFKVNQNSNWNHPPKEFYPINTKEYDKNALQTEFSKDEKDEKRKIIKITIKRGEGYLNYIAGLNFVFFDPQTNKWFNNYRKDFQIKFKLKINKKKSKQILVESGLYVPEFVLDIINCEANYGTWTLMHRYNKCYDIIQNFDENTSNEKYIWILIWLKFSHEKKLDWQRNFNTNQIQLSESMNKLSLNLTNQYKIIYKKEKLYNNIFYSRTSLIKNILSQIGKGMLNGQEIRDEILKVMRKNKIPKNHINNFYEQWHQKLHNNSTPEDIIICEAVVDFLKSKGDINVYYDVLKRGGITKEILASYDKKIINEPYYSSAYNIQDFEHFLFTLKSVHSSTDLFLTYQQCKYAFNDKEIQIFDFIVNYNNDSNIIFLIQKVTEAREFLHKIIINNLNDINKLRDILFFELSLEIYVKQLVEKIIHIPIDYDKYIDEINLIMRNIKLSYPNYSEFSLTFNDWFNIVDKLKNDNSKNSFLKVKSVFNRLNRILSSVIDFYNNYFNARARYFGKECAVDNEYSNLFAEKMIRGTIFFALSILLKKIEPIIRKNVNLSDWLIISRNKDNLINGNLIYVKNLTEIQFNKYKEKIIILTENINGNEEIPKNCIGIILIKSDNYPDILSHISVRIRNLNCLFSVCFNENICNEILKLINEKVELNILEKDIRFKKLEKEEKIKEEEKKELKLNIINPGEKYEKIYLELNEFTEKTVGLKSLNTQKIYKKITNCDFIKYPESFTIPFNVNEYFLSLPENKEIKEELEEYLSKIKIAIKEKDIKNLLEKCRKTILKIKYVLNDETKKLKEKLILFGIKESEFEEAFLSIKKVWSSKYNERVYLSISKLGISLDNIKMSILVQKIIPSEYSFVIHTKNPLNNNNNELYGEIVIGMGETLVGNYEGESFSFIYNKINKNYEIKSYPNKSISLNNLGFIFRSDSNIEDLKYFSGAGLFDSFTIYNHNSVELSYFNDKLFSNDKFVEMLILNVSKLGIEIENFCGCEQDIEGAYFNNDFYILQNRNQV